MHQTVCLIAPRRLCIHGNFHRSFEGNSTAKAPSRRHRALNNAILRCPGLRCSGLRLFQVVATLWLNNDTIGQVKLGVKNRSFCTDGFGFAWKLYNSTILGLPWCKPMTPNVSTPRVEFLMLLRWFLSIILVSSSCCTSCSLHSLISMLALSPTRKELAMLECNKASPWRSLRSPVHQPREGRQSALFCPPSEVKNFARFCPS